MRFWKTRHNRLLAKYLICIFFSLTSSNLFASTPSQSDTVYNALQRIQNPYNKLWKRAGWWNSANILEAVCDYYKRKEICDTAMLQKLYARNKLSLHSYRNNFINIAFDDNAWWAISWLKAYELAGDPKYYKVAEKIWADMQQHAWTDKCGGGVQWRRPTAYKNAITNELFMLLSSRLSALAKHNDRREFYKSWALKEWNWLKGSGMMNSDFLFNDGLDDNCRNNNQTTWSYNQGVVLGGLVQLYQLTKDTTYVLLAEKIALAAVAKLSNARGILVEPCNDNCGADGLQFKSAFVRHLAPLVVITKNKALIDFIHKNAASAWQQSHNADFLFNHRWDRPFKEWTGAAQGDMLDLLNTNELIDSLPK